MDNPNSIINKWLNNYNSPSPKELMKHLPLIFAVVEYPGMREFVKDLYDGVEIYINSGLYIFEGEMEKHESYDDFKEREYSYPPNLIKLDKNYDYPNNVLVPMYHYFKKKTVRKRLDERGDKFEGIEKYNNYYRFRWGS